MPWKPAQPCRRVRCPRRTLRPTGLCLDHEREETRAFDAKRGGGQERGYGVAWQKLRREHLLIQPLCASCGARATDVDHIKRKVEGGTDRPANLQSLCHGCHSRKTSYETRASDRGRENIKISPSVRACAAAAPSAGFKIGGVHLAPPRIR